MTSTNLLKEDIQRRGAVKDRSQTHNPKTNTWVKRDSGTEKFIDQKHDPKSFKGVRKGKKYKEFPELSDSAIDTAIVSCCASIPAPRPRDNFLACMKQKLGVG